jgi:hypothetical protein
MRILDQLFSNTVYLTLFVISVPPFVEGVVEYMDKHCNARKQQVEVIIIILK